MIEINFCPDKSEDEVSHLELDMEDEVLDEIKLRAEEMGVKFESLLAEVLKEALINIAEDEDLKEKIREGLVIPD